MSQVAIRFGDRTEDDRHLQTRSERQRESARARERDETPGHNFSEVAHLFFVCI